MSEELNDGSERTTFVGFDWAGDHPFAAQDKHDVVVVEARGAIVEDFRFDDTAEGWSRVS